LASSTIDWREALGIGEALGRVGAGGRELLLDALVRGRELGLRGIGSRQAFADLLGALVERHRDRRPHELHREPRQDQEDDRPE
jgi:hypothetical protein